MSDFDWHYGATGQRDWTRAPAAWKIDTDLSSQDRTVFYHEGTGRAVVSFRATDWRNKGDLDADAHIAFGLEILSKRFKESEAITRLAMTKYGAGNVEAAGHSLGGTQALYVNGKLGIRATAFNPGFGPEQLARSRADSLHHHLFGGAPPGGNNMTVYQSGPNDLISTMARKGKGFKLIDVPQTIRAKEGQGMVAGIRAAHSLDNFLPSGKTYQDRAKRDPLGWKAN